MLLKHVSREVAVPGDVRASSRQRWSLAPPHDRRRALNYVRCTRCLSPRDLAGKIDAEQRMGIHDSLLHTDGRSSEVLRYGTE